MAKRPTASGVISDARSVAWEMLRQVEEEGAYADALLGHRLNAEALSPRDQALLTRLVYGTLAWQGYIDHILVACARRPPAELDAPIRVLLRLALLQICVLTKIPAFAAVDTAVELAKRYRQGAAASLVNGVLRRAASHWQQVELPSREHDPIGYLATRLSHPPWLVERWIAQYGFDETEALLRADNEPAPTVLRTNRRLIASPALLARLVDAGCAAVPTAYSPCGIRVDSAGGPERLPGYEDGYFSLQGEASQLVSELLAPQPGGRVLDACAAPGGKTTHLAELMDDRGEIVALDPNVRGMRRLEQMARRLRLSIVHPVVADVLQWRAPMPFDYVLVDAPCSGLGTLRAHPEIKWRRTPADLRALATLQSRLLTRLSDCVSPGGVLVYATCTLTREENEEVLQAFFGAHPEFHLEDPRPLLSAAARHLVGSDGALHTLPHRDGLDGFFAVRLRRDP